MMSKHSLYKYLPKLEWAQTLRDGQVYFQPLSHFQQIEDEQIRGDSKEAVSVFQPTEGLQINNLTTGQSLVLADHRFESAAKADEIFVFCMSLSFKNELAKDFGAAACLEIQDIQKFCSMVTKNLPTEFVLPPVDRRPRIGHKVRYYDATEPPLSRWALPELIAISKRNHFSLQDEFRLVFGRKNVFNFENTKLEIRRGQSDKTETAAVSSPIIVQAGDISSFCKIHQF